MRHAFWVCFQSKKKKSIFFQPLFPKIPISSAILVVECAFRLTPRIIGGKKAQIEQFKWQAVLVYESKIFCGGTIISPTKIVTAAHCVIRITDTGPLQVRVGSSEWKTGGQLVNVSHLVRHPDYNEPTLLNNDVAVIILKEPLTFGTTIGSVALADIPLELPAGKMMNISGFGTTSLSSNSPNNTLHYVTVPIVSLAKCKEAYKKYPGFAKITDNMICAGFFGVGGKDSCGGDSGGLFNLTHKFKHNC